MPEIKFTPAQIEAKLGGLFREILELESGDLTAITKEGLGERWASMRHAELIIATQKLFSIRLSYAEILKIQSYESLRDIVLAHCAAVPDPA